jgi:hypothetical protein
LESVAAAGHLVGMPDWALRINYSMLFPDLEADRLHTTTQLDFHH